MRFWQMQRKADVHFWSLDAAIKVLFKSATCNSSSKVYIPHLYELIIALPVFLKHQSLLEKSRLNTEKTALIMGQDTKVARNKASKIVSRDRLWSQFYFTPLS